MAHDWHPASTPPKLRLAGARKLGMRVLEAFADELGKSAARGAVLVFLAIAAAATGNLIPPN